MNIPRSIVTDSINSRLQPYTNIFRHITRSSITFVYLRDRIPKNTEQYTVKKRGVLPNPQKRFRRCQKASKCVQSLKKRIRKSTKPSKVLPVYPGEEPSSTKPFLSSVQEKKVIQNLQSFTLHPMNY